MTPDYQRGVEAALCRICGEPNDRAATGLLAFMCSSCSRSYDRSAHNVGTVMEAMIWAAGRAQRAERRRSRRSPPAAVADPGAVSEGDVARFRRLFMRERETNDGSIAWGIRAVVAAVRADLVAQVRAVVDQHDQQLCIQRDGGTALVPVATARLAGSVAALEAIAGGAWPETAIRAEATPPVGLAPVKRSGHHGDFANCANCGGQPHTWEACARGLRGERDRLIDTPPVDLAALREAVRAWLPWSAGALTRLPEKERAIVVAALALVDTPPPDAAGSVDRDELHDRGVMDAILAIQGLPLLDRDGRATQALCIAEAKTALARPSAPQEPAEPVRVCKPCRGHGFVRLDNGARTPCPACRGRGTSDEEGGRHG